MAQRGKPKENYLLLVISLSLVLGMAVALGVYFAWTSGIIPRRIDHPLTIGALLICPPFILAALVAPSPDSNLAFVLVVGTIIFANAFLYGGVAAAVYFVVSVVVGRKREKTAPP